MTTCNLNGLKINGHLVARRLKRPPTCIVFQETKMRNAQQLDTFHHHLDNEVGDGNYTLFTNDPRTTSADPVHRRHCGVASFFHKSMPGYSTLVHLSNHDIPGRYLVARTLWSGLPVYIHNIYAPVESHLRGEFFARLPRDFEPDSLHLVGGDFNLPQHSSLDAKTVHSSHESGKPDCVEWLTALGVIDVWRQLNPSTRLFSGPGRVNRLDYIFLHGELVSHLNPVAKYDPNGYGGDHLTHTVTLSQSPSTTTKGYWRLPRELLTDPNIQRAITMEATTLLDRMRADDSLNHGAMWYGWLKRMRRQLIKCHRLHTESTKTHLQHLRLCLAAAKRALECDRDHATKVANVAVAQLAFDSAKTEHGQYARDRQFDFHANSNERGTSHFFRKPLGTKVPINGVTVDGTLVTDVPTVQNKFTAHWRSIMASPQDVEPPDQHRRCAVIEALTKRLELVDRESLDEPITVKELCDAMKTMNPSKSPGPDGWSAGFFQVAPEIFSELLLLVFNYQLTHHGCLLPHQRRSAITLLYKSGDRGLPGNYRPISLMPVEVKVLSRALAFRLARHAPQLIHPTQAGFVPGRRLHDHVTSVQALQHYCTLEDQDSYATFLDFSKAYDMVDQSFLFEVLAEMNLGANFISWVRLLYNSPVAHLLFNGTLGPAIKPTRGVKQGCPLSCLLFVFYLEPLGDMLRRQPQHGIPLPHGESITSIFFADDSTLLSKDLPAAVAQLAIVEEFCAVSGARLNQSKCQTLVLNGHLDPADTDGGGLLNIVPTGQPVKYLGLMFGHQLQSDYQLNLINERFLASFQQWGCRARTLQGRRLLANTVMLSLLWHVTAAISVPPGMVQSWQAMLNRYILGRKTVPTDRYRSLLSSPLQFDMKLGLGLPHVASRIRAQRLQLLQRAMAMPTADRALWQPLVLRQFERAMGRLYRESNPFDFLLYHPHHKSKWLKLWELHPLWIDVWRHWSATPMDRRIQLPLSPAALMRLPVWLTTYQPTLSNGQCAAGIVSTPPTRRWCSYGASNQLRCLADIAAVHGRWPTRPEFMVMMSQGNPAAPVAIGRDGTMQWATVYRSGMIYNHLSCVHTNVLGLNQLPQLATPAPAMTRHPFYGMAKVAPIPFELWPRRMVLALAYHAPLTEGYHPMSSAVRTTTAAIQSYVRRVRQTCRIPPPVQGDVWLRLLFCMIPVNCRFAHLQVERPDAICCAYGCGAVETQHHAFHACPQIYSVWSFHRAAWQRYGVSFAWSTMADLDLFTVNERGGHLKDAIKTLWILLTASTLHLIWTKHNKVQYEDATPLPSYAWNELSFVGWTMSVRRWLRLQDPDCPLRSSVLRVLHALRSSANYRPLWIKYPYSLRLAPTTAADLRP
jgi:exonuclease III